MFAPRTEPEENWTRRLHGTQKPVGLIGYRNFRASGKPAGTPPPSRRSDPKYAPPCPVVSTGLGQDRTATHKADENDYELREYQ